MTSKIYKLNGLTEREAIADAFNRMGLAYDLDDFGLLKSALTTEAIIQVPVCNIEIKGLEQISKTSFNKIGHLLTSHLSGNVRIPLESNNAKSALMSVISTNQHIRSEDQDSEEIPNQFTSGTYSELEVLKGDDGLWKINRWMINILWKSGDPEIVRSSKEGQ